MSHSYIVKMVQSPGLRDRIVGCAALEGIANASVWVEQHIYEIVARTDWVQDFQFAEENKTENVNQDTGARTDVINDGDITAAVQDVLASA